MLHRFNILMLCVCVLGAGISRAGVVLNDPVVWTNSPSLEGWTNTLPIGDGIADLDNPGTGGADGDGYLRISFTNTFEIIPIQEEDTIYDTQFTNGVAIGDGLGGVRFSFLVEDELPVSAFLTWHSTNMASTDQWQYAFTPTQTNVWESFTIPFTGGAGWNSSGATDFFDDLASVDWIGINISRMQDTFTYVYGLDNWEYMPIPEPTGIALIAMALLAVTGARRKFGEKAEGSET